MVVDSSEIAQVGLKTQHAKIAALLSLIPGFGQFYNKQLIKGVLFFIVMSCFGVFTTFYNKDFGGYLRWGPSCREITQCFCWPKG